MRVVLLTNFMPPYRVSFYKELGKNVKEFIILISTPMEKGRHWQVNWSNLKVQVQRTITFRRTWKHPHGFTEALNVHFPLDTINRLKKIEPDWIISSELGIRTLQSIIYKRFHPETKLAIWATLSEYSEMGRGLLRETLRKWIIPKADLIFVNGESGQRYIQRFRFPPERIVHIPYTTNLTPFLNINLHRDEICANRLLFSGQLIPRKGLLEFHQAFCNWAQAHPEKTWEWWCIGDGPLKEQLLNLKTPSNAVIKLCGNVDFDDLVIYYQQAGAFIFPTLADEWGVVINEAMGSGLPIVGSIYSQAVEELVEDDVTGWLFHPDCPNEIYSALEKFFSTDKSELLNMRIAAREKILKVTPEIIAKEMVEALGKYRI